jgi:NADPH:quinone reductase-like Zn-dependent oxidoreductase
MTRAAMMRAALCEGFGGAETVRLADIPRPEPGPGEVLVRIHASTLDSGDGRVRRLDMPPGFGPIARLVFGFSRPRQPILGTTLAGTIAATGPGVTTFAPGDAVVASPGAAMGCHADYRVIKLGKAIVPKPQGLSFAVAAASVFGGMAARHLMVECAKVNAADRVLVNGAAGVLGLAALQLAKAAGAHVTAVCSAGKAELVRAHGADAVIDYRQQDPRQGGAAYDLVFDAAGSTPVRHWFSVVPKGGRICAATASLGDLLAMPWFNMVSGRRILGGVVPETAAALAQVLALAATGTIRPHIGAQIPLDRIREAHALLDSGQKRGSIVITMT